MLRPVRKPSVLARARTGFVRTGRGLRRGVHHGARTGSARRTTAAAAGRPPEDVAGSALARLTILPALLLTAWLLPGLPLLLAGEFVPVPMLLISAPLLVGLVANGLRVVPSVAPAVPGRARPQLAVVVRADGHRRGGRRLRRLAARRAVGVGHRAPLAGRLPAGRVLAGPARVAAHPAVAGRLRRAHAGLGFSSTGFFAHGASVVPLGTSGLPMLLAGGFWAHGTAGAAALGPLLGGFAVLSFGGLIARLAGPQWVPAAPWCSAWPCPSSTSPGRRSPSPRCRCCCSAACACSSTR